jgi:hypothetical protein
MFRFKSLNIMATASDDRKPRPFLLAASALVFTDGSEDSAAIFPDIAKHDYSKDESILMQITSQDFVHDSCEEMLASRGNGDMRSSSLDIETALDAAFGDSSFMVRIACFLI